MRYRHLLAALALLLPANASRAIEPSDLKPGLVATYRDGNDGVRSVTRSEPTVALTLAKGESPHPALANGARMTWTGYINITRAGKYTFDANPRGGKLTVKIGGKAVSFGAPVQYDGGVLAFEATFTRDPVGAPCRVEVLWNGPGFVKEPLNYQYLGHLEKERPKAFATDGQLEHGRFKFEELSCIRCHQPAANNKMAKTLADRPGPNLNAVAKRAYPGWIYTWLADPAKLRKHTTMPKMFTDDDTGTAERYAVTQYLVSLSGKPLDVYKLPTVVPGNLKQSMERGRVLYHVTGCAACHDEPAKKKKNEEDDRDPLTPADYIYGLNTLTGPVAKYSLGELGSKFRPETLAAFLQNPLKTHPSGRMPHMNLNATEATDIARYLCRTVDEDVPATKPPMPKVKPADILDQLPKVKLDKPDDKFDELPVAKQWVVVGRTLFAKRGCANCHSVEANGKFAQPEGFASLAKVAEAGAKGCLSTTPKPAQNPVYKLMPSERAALAAFVKDGFTGPGSPRARLSRSRRPQAIQLPELPPARRRGRHSGRSRRRNAQARKGGERGRCAAPGAHRHRAQGAHRVAEGRAYPERARPAVDATPHAAVR